jgi:hypothetical protein
MAIGAILRMKLCPKCGKQFPDDANFCPVDAGRLEPLDDPGQTHLGPHVADAAEGDASAGPEPLGGRFSLGEPIGGGRTGQIFAASDGKTGASCVVKLVREEVFPTPLLLQRSERELKQLQRLDAPGVARVLDHGKRDGALWIAVERVEGRSLEREVAASGPMTVERAARVVHAVGAALAEAARLGVIHRDLSPKNVLLGGDGDAVKVINFGVAVPLGGRVQGVPEYIAPEQAEGKPVDQRSNIYSLGAMFYFLVAGRPPHLGDAEEVLAAHRNQAPPAPSQFAAVPEAVEALILKALERTSSKRYMTLRQLLGEIERCLSGDAPSPATTQPLGLAAQVASAAAAGKRKPKELAQTLVGMGALGKDDPGDNGAAAPGGAADDDNRVTGVVAARAPGGEPQAVIVGENDPTAPSPALDDGAPPPEPVLPEPAPFAAAPFAPAPVALAPAGGGIPNPQAQSARAGSEPQDPSRAGGKARSRRRSSVQPAPAQRPQADSKGKFRETMWFKKGELDEAAAEAAAVAAARGEDDEVLDRADSMPVEDRYKDDGTLTADDRERLSLRTGGTQAMKALRDSASASGSLSKVSEDDLISEMRSGRKLIIGGIVAAVVVVVVILLVAL